MAVVMHDECAERRIAAAGNQFVIFEADAEKGRNDGIRRYDPGKRQGELAELCCHVVLFFAILHAGRGFLFVLGSALGLHLVGHENAVMSVPAFGDRLGAVDEACPEGDPYQRT